MFLFFVYDIIHIIYNNIVSGYQCGADIVHFPMLDWFLVRYLIWLYSIKPLYSAILRK